MSSGASELIANLPLLEGLPHAAWLVALHSGQVVAANAAAGTLLGRTPSQLLGLPADTLVTSPEDQAWWLQAREGAATALHSDTVMALWPAAYDPPAAPVHVSRSIGLIHNQRGMATHALVMLVNRHSEQRHHGERELLLAELQATVQATAEQRIEALSLQDALCGLPNRRRLAQCVAQALLQTKRGGGIGVGSFALLFIDLDRFCQINDSLGQEVGDQVLQSVAQRIQACLRGDDVLARLGGDQFVALVHAADANSAEATARRVLNAVAQPSRLDDAQFTLTCSIGISLAPSHGNQLDELLRHAEGAMRVVKSKGRAHCRLHQARAEVDRRAHMKLDHAMRQALVSGRFRLHYQPQVDLGSGRVVGAEALLRWRDPEMGDVSPGHFIPVAEDSGFIVAIGDWVLGQAVRQAALWHSRGLRMPIAINVSALQFQQAHFVDRVASVLAVAGLPAQLLELELTESILVHDADEALQRLHALAKLGLQLSIDDFGTGYSSLSYLKRFPINKLKIDRSFVSGLPADDSDAGIVRAILQMASALDMRVIAEGVETHAQRDFLQHAGCDEFQGFLFAPALDVLSFERRLSASDHVPPVTRPRMRLVHA
jgi:diguanylate cyclase (GGDEF)-like protein